MNLVAELSAIVGPPHVLTDPATKAPFEWDWTRRFGGPARLVVRPADTGELAEVVKVCAHASVPVIPQGGNTGLVGGGVPARSDTEGTAVVVSTTRLRRLDPVDVVAAQVTAGAGVPLAHLQEAAAAAGLSFAVDLAARDSATVGGMVATNAGGLHVLRYGSMRVQVVGLEAVLADGTVLSRLSGLVKDNTGYDLSQLLVGSEGTLAVITAARLRLVAHHPEKVVALLGLPDTARALSVLETLRKRVEGLQAAEIFFADGLEVVCRYAGLGPPLPWTWPVYLVVECAGLEDPSAPMFEVLAELDLDEAATAVATDSSGQSRLWAYRERHTEAVSALGIPHKLDVTLPQARLADFETSVRQVVASAAPGSTLVLFGHVGDGNLHVNVVGPDPEDETVDEAVLNLVAAMDGSISAEHGIGRAKAEWLHLSRTTAELTAMRALKSALDPEQILNPGVLFPGELKGKLPMEAASSAGELAAAVQSRQISSRELLELYLGRIEKLNPKVNAVVTLSPERAWAEAAQADEDTARGRVSGPLHGLPITIKDAIETAGIVSTGGAVELVNHVPALDAPSVARLRRAGAIVFGKTNVPRWSGDIQTFNDLFGTTNNPWNLDRTPGGSSGGAAAAVATGLTTFEMGTDIGGSVRIPSSFCGVYGHKPSFGLVSQRGYLDRVGGGIIDSDINVFGPMARSATDLDLLLGVLAGPNPEDEAAWSIRLPPPRHDDLSAYRIGTWLDDPACSVDAACLERLEGAAQALRRAGAQVSAAHPPLELADVNRLFNTLLIPAISPSIDDPDLAVALGGNHLDWLRAHQERTLLRRIWHEWFRDFDALLCPVMPMAAFRHDHHGTINDRRVVINGTERNQGDTLMWTGLVGVAYLPSTVVPVGPTPDGLPVGLQIVGPYLEDRTPLFLAVALSELVGGFVKPQTA